MRDLKILIFGDSIVRGNWDDQGGWAVRLQQLANQHTVTTNFEEYLNVYPLGIPGNTTRQLLTRLESETRMRIKDTADPETIIVLAVGVNDSVWLLADQAHQVPEVEFQVNLDQLVKTAQQFSPTVMLLGITDVDESRVRPIPWFVEGEYRNDGIKTYNGIIAQIAEQSGAKFISLAGLLQPTDLIDGVHPNTAGHAKIYQAVRKALQPMIGSSFEETTDA